MHALKHKGRLVLAAKLAEERVRGNNGFSLQRYVGQDEEPMPLGQHGFLVEDWDDDGDRRRLHGDGDPWRNARGNQSRGATGGAADEAPGAAVGETPAVEPGGQE